MKPDQYCQRLAVWEGGGGKEVEEEKEDEEEETYFLQLRESKVKINDEGFGSHLHLAQNVINIRRQSPKVQNR